MNKSYKDTIKMLAECSVDSYLSGGNHFTFDSHIVSFVYGIDSKQVEADVRQMTNHILSNR